MRNLLSFIILLFIFSSCKISEYPATGNYAVKSKIEIIGNYPIAEKKTLEKKLDIQIDDSLQPSKVTKKTSGFLGFIKKPVNVYHNFDSTSISRTLDFFDAAYIANGYFRGGTTTYKFDTLANTKGRGIIITFEARPFKNHYMDSIDYVISDTTINKLVAQKWNNSILKKKDIYAQDLLDGELRRITYDLRNAGYLFINKEDFKIIADTVNTALLDISPDPIEQQQFLAKAAEFEANPNTDITIALRDKVAPKKLKQYYVGNINVYSDNFDRTITPPNTKPIRNGNINKLFFKDNIRDSILVDHIFLEKGKLYRDIDVSKTIQSINILNVWQQVAIEPNENKINNDTIDFNIYMLPYAQFESELKIEGTYITNNLDLISSPKNLLGANLFFNVKNRNFRNKAVQNNITINGGFDFGKQTSTTAKQNIINTVQFGLNYNYLFPELKILSKYNKKENIFNTKSGFNLNFNYSERLNFFKLLEISPFYNSQFDFKSLKGKQRTWNFQINLGSEIRKLDPKNELRTLIAANPVLENIYRAGITLNILPPIINATEKHYINIKSPLKKLFMFRRYGFEHSGPLWFKDILKKDLLSFFKLELDHRFLLSNPVKKVGRKNDWAFRVFTGVGVSYNKSLNQNATLPFFKQFAGGGPSSLRAWGVRGVNSYSTRKTITNNAVSEYFGDLQFECNVEYRHKLFSFLGFPVEGAGFVDMGNIWNWKPLDRSVYPNKPLASIIADDIAIATGYGLRIDFSYILLRFDLAGKFKDPKTIDGRGGFLTSDNTQLKDIKFQLGINYPF
jgi:outer membrane protein insertion porin family